MSLLKPKAENTVLTPIQIDYNKLFSNVEVVHFSAVNRMTQIAKEIKKLEHEQYKLEDIIDKTKASIDKMKERQ